MTNCYPEWYQQALFSALELEPGDEGSRRIRESLKGINLGYSGGKSASAFENPDVVKAYTLYYMSIYLPKLWFIFDHAPTALTALLSSNQSLSLREVGCGPGTFLWSLLFYLKAKQPEALDRIVSINGCDLARPALACAKNLGDRFLPALNAEHIGSEWTCADWRQAGPGGDILIFGNTLIEGNPAETKAVLHLAEKSKMVILIEPGTPEAFRRMLPLRSALLNADWHLHFPCPAESSCPMTEENWCHFQIARHGLPFLQRMGAAVQQETAGNFLSAFIFTRKAPKEPADWRILSSVRKVKGIASRWLCNGNCLVEASLVRKERSEDNRPFLKCDAGTGLKITPDCTALTVTPRITKNMAIKTTQ